MVVDDRHVDDLQSAESGVLTEAPKAAAAELPEDELVVGVDPAGIGNAEHALVGSAVARHSMGLNENASTLLQAIPEAAQQAERVTDPMQDPEAKDEVEALIQVVQFERVGTPVLDARVDQGRDRAESLTPAQRNIPARLDPLDVLLVVDCQNPLSSPASATKA